MAVYSQRRRAGSRTSIAAAGEQELPNGSCNFSDITFGARGPTCGCRRFWLNESHFNGQNFGADRAWCFCGHHACFHDAFSQQRRLQEQAAAACEVDEGEDCGFVDNDNNAHDVPVQRSASTPPKQVAGLGIRPDSRSQPQSIDTRVWQALNEFARNQEDGVMSDTTSKLPSTAAPSVIDETRLSPNRTAQPHRLMGPPVNIPTGSLHPRPAEDYSATEVATPSIAGTPDFRALASSSSNARTSPAHVQPTRLEPVASSHHSVARPAQFVSNTTEQRPATTVNPPMSAQDVQSIIRTYGRRIEALEGLSFSHVPAEEIQERFDHFDSRIIDLEQWRIEQDRMNTSPAPDRPTSSKRRRLLPTENSSFASDASFDISAAAHTEAAVLASLAVNAETHPRIDALESRVVDLENAALPSFTRPWQVQVVLLPWGREMRGIWFSSTEATQQSLKSSSTQVEQEWTGAESAPKLSFKSSASGAWTTESIEAWANEAQEWLSPKACGPNGMVFQRLASRGLIRDVSFSAPDARHILDTIASTFGATLGTGSELETEQRNRYQGLRERFIPLRKVRKSTRLRFLSPAEMVTSATWTAGFLDSSVFMKVSDGQRRLYITTPDAYVQPNGEACSWPKIRDLPLFDASGEEQAAQADRIVIESCWTYNQQLDQAISVHSSFASRESQWSIRSQHDDLDHAQQKQPPMSPQSELQSRLRTVSLPSSTSAGADQARDALPKRRIASFETAATQSVHVDGDTATKRRRISPSPEVERRGVNFTPRWSREPPSPYTAEARSQGSRRTPFAYATPHSNSNYVAGRVDLTSGDGDTEADTDIVGEHSERGGEEEWAGVEDNTNADVNPSDVYERSFVHGGDLEEEDLDEGITIYEQEQDRQEFD